MKAKKKERKLITFFLTLFVILFTIITTNGVNGYVRHTQTWEMNSINTNYSWIAARNSEIEIDGNSLTNFTSWQEYNFSITYATPPSSYFTTVKNNNKLDENFDQIIVNLEEIITNFKNNTKNDNSSNYDELISKISKISNQNDPINGWIKAEVPGTILTTLVRNNYFPNPYNDLNSLEIPDIFDTGIDYYSFWYYLNISIPYSNFYHYSPYSPTNYPYKITKYLLHFRGINYAADLYINGFKINNDTMIGMFNQFEFDITKYLEVNKEFTQFALQIQPPNPPGNGTEGQCGDGRIAQSVTCQYMAGWDWIQSTRDRSTGMWDKVELYGTGDVMIKSIHLMPLVPGIRSPFDTFQSPAYLNVSIDLQNLINSSVSSQICLRLFNPSNSSSFSHLIYENCLPFQLNREENDRINFDSITINNPLLWWPNGYGEQPLYTSVVYIVNENTLSDESIERFGLREFSSSLNINLNNSREFYVNGNKIFIRGGNWIGIDSMFQLTKYSQNRSSLPENRSISQQNREKNWQIISLQEENLQNNIEKIRREKQNRLTTEQNRSNLRTKNNNSEKNLQSQQINDKLSYLYEQEVKMHADMNLNLIRVWGGGITERPEFYDACDYYGILVWQEFWITGDCNGQWNDTLKKDSQARRRAYPGEHSLFLLSAAKSIEMVRNHASILLWVGGNEYPPPSDLDKGLSDLVSKLDPNRLYLSSSLSGGVGPGDGPYNINNPKWFFENQDVNVFNPEMGSVGTPTAESIKRFISEDNLKPFGDNNKVWEHHKYISYYSVDKEGKTIVPSQIDMYGIPLTIDQFCLQAQLANYVQYQALYEGRVEHMWEWYTGIMVWKSQNPWTGLRGQFYDWFGEQLGSFFGSKIANENIHVQMNLSNRQISIINHSLSNFSNFNIVYEIYQLNNSIVDHFESGICDCFDRDLVLANSVFRCCFIPDLDNIHFIQLKLIHYFDENDNYRGNKFNINNKINNKYNNINNNIENNDNNNNNNNNKKEKRGTGEIISRNFYWIGKDNNDDGFDDFLPLQNLLSPKISVEISQNFIVGNFFHLIVKIKNNSTMEEGILAFFLRIQILYSENDLDQVLPVHYDDNYFSLLPEEERSIGISFNYNEEYNQDQLPILKISGWNLSPSYLPIDR